MAKGCTSLVVDRVLEQVIPPRVRAILLDVAAHPVVHLAHVSQGVVQAGQRQVPAVIVGDGDGIVEAVDRGEDRFQAQVLAQYPIFVEVGGVPDLPAQWVHDRVSSILSIRNCDIG